jgi:hypothetical protein
VVKDHAELARLGHVTRARVGHVMSFLHPAPNLQEQLLFLPRTEHGRDPVHLRQLQPLAAMPDWRLPRKPWAKLTTGRSED